ncbi:TadE/TadG family type IV pilus assembly protein [Oricola cellulosilytica]|uniref:Pilus assembly protein n=1 Tax=Oricola cellulosilytica TaxID=1429082 RepID=A0A4R0PFF9_9HYPH|nr:TadE/TadG family type IV pilus assembly protein [Oricola cellulosilytica]TCD16371.1 pilus assembly protein [Oricola cellulosilytica]
MADRTYQLRTRIRRLVERLEKDRRGATAIEFSMLAIPFAMLAFAILESTVSFTAEEVINRAASKLGRQFQTGQLTAANTDETTFRNLLCNEISIMVGGGCPELVYDLQNYTSFAAVPTSLPIDLTGDIDVTGFGYNVGGAGTINSLRVFYRWPVMTDMLKAHMSNLPDNKTLLYATVTWKNEGF